MLGEVAQPLLVSARSLVAWEHPQVPPAQWPSRQRDRPRALINKRLGNHRTAVSSALPVSPDPALQIVFSPGCVSSKAHGKRGEGTRLCSRPGQPPGCQVCGHLLAPSQVCGHLLAPSQVCGHLLAPCQVCGHLLAPCQVCGHLLAPSQVCGHLLAPSQVCGHLLAPCQVCGHLLAPSQGIPPACVNIPRHTPKLQTHPWRRASPGPAAQFGSMHANGTGCPHKDGFGKRPVHALEGEMMGLFPWSILEAWENRVWTPYL
ncbi:uncharacterized protein LOC116589461 [Mustela erminea]|uniref:uncharacterized protein LOC116589461 n=1 Tax=Mustela erminea TaxID=36723 RepID=UPI0013872A9A|nr:uncharacterized protein LOC116589461 [Mustela erminea]